MAFFDNRDFRSAISEFYLAARLVPSASIWFNIARAHEELGERPAAIEHYRLYLRDAVDPRDAEEVQERIARLQAEHEEARAAALRGPTEGTLRLTSNAEGALVLLDGEEVGRTPIDEPIRLAPGHHELSLEQDGQIPFRANVRIESGVTTGAQADLQPATGYRSVRGRRLWTWIIGGLAVAGAGAGIGLGVYARTQRDQDLDRARDWARYSDIAVGTAAALAVGAIVLYFVEGRAVRTERTSGAPAGAP